VSKLTNEELIQFRKTEKYRIWYAKNILPKKKKFKKKRSMRKIYKMGNHKSEFKTKHESFGHKN